MISIMQPQYNNKLNKRITQLKVQKITNHNHQQTFPLLSLKACAYSPNPPSRSPDIVEWTGSSVPQVASWWQLAYCGSAVVAAFFWQISADDYSKCPGLDTVSAFVGGMLMLFGARMAAGCTSGHGISGCAIGMIQSFIGVPAMFMGGIIVGMIWNFGINAETYIPTSSY